MDDKKLKYEMTEQVVNYILNALNRTQIAGVQQAKDLLGVVQMLQTPSNADELDKKQFEALKAKFEPSKDGKKK